MENKVYHTDGIHEFIALWGFDKAVQVVARTLDVTEAESRKRLEYAQKHSNNEV